MISQYKIIFAKNVVLSDLESKSLITKEELKEMRAIGNNPDNKTYALGLLKFGIANNKYSAVAAMFARIGVHALRSSETSQPSSIGFMLWDQASVRALVRAGANAYEARSAANELIEMVKQSAEKDIDFLIS